MKSKFRLYRAGTDQPTTPIKDVRTVFPDAPVREYVELENTQANATMIKAKAQEGILFFPLWLPKRVTENVQSN